MAEPATESRGIGDVVACPPRTLYATVGDQVVEGASRFVLIALGWVSVGFGVPGKGPQ